MTGKLKQLLKNNSSLPWRDWDRMKSCSKTMGLCLRYSSHTYLITVAGIWLSATAYLKPAEPDIIQYHSGYPRRSNWDVTGYRVNENHQDGGCPRLQKVIKPGTVGKFVVRVLRECSCIGMYFNLFVCESKEWVLTAVASCSWKQLAYVLSVISYLFDLITYCLT